MSATMFLALPLVVLLVQPASDEILLLGRAKTKMAAALRGMPNYTCLQTIERSKRLAKRRKFELIDVLRLEVGLVEGKELFAWPGSGKFEDKDLTDIVPPGGAIGTGAFAGHASSVFQGRAASITFDAWEENPRRARYAFRVPQNLSGYTIRNQARYEARVAYHGHFWVTPEDERVVRIEVEADDIPIALELLATGLSIDYRTMKIGDIDYWLPMASSMKMTNLDSSEYRNETTFSGCRQFSGESSLRFDDPEPEPASATTAALPEKVSLPKGQYFAIQLAQPLLWGKTVTGDKLQATLADAIKQRGAIVFPKGSVIEGRVISLQAQQGGQLLELQFDTITHQNRTADFRAQCFQPIQSLSVRPSRPSAGERELRCNPGRPGSIVIATARGETNLAKGFRLTWTTVD